MNTIQACLRWFLLANFVWKGAVALYCVQCESFEDPLCTAALVPPTRCESPSATACLTYIGKMPIPGMDMVIRDCAKTDMGNFCQKVPQGPRTFAHEFCVRTCYTDKCNDVPLAAPPQLQLNML